MRPPSVVAHCHGCRVPTKALVRTPCPSAQTDKHSPGHRCTESDPRRRSPSPSPGVALAPPVAVLSDAAPVFPLSTPGPRGVPPSRRSPARLRRYHLLDRLARWMADVFTAVAHGVEGFTRVFVLKRLRPELAHDKQAVAQFIDEARMQSNLVHSNIVPVFDFGRVGNEYFMTQEYIVGRDVVRLIARYYEHTQQTLTPRLAYYIAHETLQALQYAHSNGSRGAKGNHLGNRSPRRLRAATSHSPRAR